MNGHIIEFHARLVAFYERIKNINAAKYHLRIAWQERKKAYLNDLKLTLFDKGCIGTNDRKSLEDYYNKPLSEISHLSKYEGLFK